MFEKMVKSMNNKYNLQEITHNKDLMAVTNIQINTREPSLIATNFSRENDSFVGAESINKTYQKKGTLINGSLEGRDSPTLIKE